MAQEEKWILMGARLALGSNEAKRLDLEIGSGKILSLRSPGKIPKHAKLIDLRGCLILPGLINAHDHLEFNLFPRLGRGPYPNAGAWARDIYQPDQSPIREHLRIPLATRLRWGGVKNLLSGVTTVCHHNPCDLPLFDRNFPVRIAKKIGWAHSLEFSPDLDSRFHRTPAAWPFVLHLGEAVGRPGTREIFALRAMDALDRRTVLVHGVALDKKGLELARRKGASLVWCPSSNLHILGRTLRPSVFRSSISVALGTDSALSGLGDLLDEIRVARRTSRLPIDRLYRMVTTDPAQILRLKQGEGTLREGGVADLVVVRDRGRTPAATLAGLQTGEFELVLVGGEVKLASTSMAAQFPRRLQRRLSLMEVDKKRRLLLSADLPKLFDSVSRILGADIRLAGKSVRVRSLN